MSIANQRGVMLIELMIGLVIGLLTSLAITQVLTVAEGQRRTAMSGADAQVNGALALHGIQRDIRQAGYGIADNPGGLGCTVNAKFGSQAALALTMAPVVITDNGDNPDTVMVFSSGKAGASMPLLVTEDHTQAGTSFVVKSSFSAAVGDLMVAAPDPSVSSACSLFAVTSTTATTIGHAVANSWNADQGTRFPAAGYAAKSYLLNLGSDFTYRVYSVSNEMLQVTELDTATGKMGSSQNVYPGIVNLQVLYGKDTDGDRIIDSYNTTKPTTAAGWQQVLAIRLALVARSTQFEKDEVTGAAPEWDLGTAVTVSGSATCASGSGGKCLSLKVSHLTDWKHYRYKVYDTLIPLRNVLWNS